MILFKYNARSLAVRWRSTLATIGSIALVVAVFVLVMALAQGLKGTFLHSGDARNLLVVRKGALAESSSQITLEEVRRTRDLGGIARNDAGAPLASAEVIILITLERGTDSGTAHVQVRGLGPVGKELRPEIQLIEGQGRMFRPGLRECIVSRRIADRFPECGLGRTFKSGRNSWMVVGLFNADKTAYESEIWMDADEAREAFNRSFYCSIMLRPENGAAAAELIRRIETDKDLQLEAMTEREYFEEQTRTAAPIRIFGVCLAAIMSIGAAFSAMNTFYALVGARAREIGTLRVLGFRRSSIYLGLIFESVLIALVGGAIGCLLSLPLNGLATGTFNWATFAEVAFEFRITPILLGVGMMFAVAMGVMGALLPARLAARQTILEALRSN